VLLKEFIAARLRDLRFQHDLTQEQVAALLGADVKWYQRLEWAEKDLRASTVDRLAALFGIDALVLLANKLPKTTRPKKVPSAPHRLRKDRTKAARQKGRKGKRD
jgi:transcriptional regulator with XRE-family HTH domain